MTRAENNAKLGFARGTINIFLAGLILMLAVAFRQLRRTTPICSTSWYMRSGSRRSCCAAGARFLTGADSERWHRRARATTKVQLKVHHSTSRPPEAFWKTSGCHCILTAVLETREHRSC